MGFNSGRAELGQGMLRRGLLTLIGTFIFVGLGGAAVASEDDCRQVVNADGSVELICENDPGGPGDGGGGPGGPGGSPGVCQFDGAAVPCVTEYGSWQNECYVRTAEPQPPKDSAIWEDNEDGVILECTPYECAVSGTNCESASFYWAPTPPAGPSVSPEELARRAYTSMNLTMGSIGSTPPSSAIDGEALGQLGLPIWLWVANPQENTVGPIERSASDGGLSVTARGELNRTEWVISRDGQALATVTCRGADAGGTPYDGRDSTLQSPTCGFPASFNVHPGNLTVTATAYWTVTWEGGNQTGTITVPPQTSESAIRIGETQTVLN